MFNRVGIAPRFVFQISNLKSQISNLKSQISNLKSQIRSFKQDNRGSLGTRLNECSIGLRSSSVLH